MSYQAVILTVSDSCAAGTRTDTSGPAIRAMLENAGFAVQAMQTVPDEEGQISAAIVHACDILQADLVVTTGGTGLSARDVTPEATLAVLDREIRAIPVAMWVEGLKSTPRAMLSRAVAGIRGHTLVLNVPGSGKGGARKSRRCRRDARSCTQNARGRWALTKQKHALRLQRVLFHFSDNRAPTRSSFPSALPARPPAEIPPTGRCGTCRARRSSQKSCRPTASR